MKPVFSNQSRAKALIVDLKYSRYAVLAEALVMQMTCINAEIVSIYLET